MKQLLEENQQILERMRVRTNPKAREVLEFFFPEYISKAMKLWFGRCEKNDEIIKNKFSGLTKQALDGELDGWLNNATETLGSFSLKHIMSRFDLIS